MLIEMSRKHFLTYTKNIRELSSLIFLLILNWYGCIWSNKVVTFKKITYFALIEVHTICPTKKKKDMLDSENQKQSLIDAFE